MSRVVVGLMMWTRVGVGEGPNVAAVEATAQAAERALPSHGVAQGAALARTLGVEVAHVLVVAGREQPYTLEGRLLACNNTDSA
jgi:hypothetical protein